MVRACDAADTAKRSRTRNIDAYRESLRIACLVLISTITWLRIRLSKTCNPSLSRDTRTKAWHNTHKQKEHVQ
jgi:hypothetical protein